MEERKQSKIIYTLAAATVVGLIIGWIYFFYWNLETDLKYRALIGDSFGSLNALFSALALAGVVLSILLQRQELGLQRKELEETRKEFKIQNKTLSIQRFETTFFNLLSLHHQIVEGIDFEQTIELRSPRKNNFFIERKNSFNQTDDNLILNTLRGRDVFRFSFKKLHEQITQKYPLELLGNTAKLVLSLDKGHTYNLEYDDIYEGVYVDWNTDFGNYFRNLYRIVKFVHETNFVTKIDLEGNTLSEQALLQKLDELNYVERYRYTSMIRAQLSDYELGWVFYNCLSSLGSEKFKPLLEKYGLLKNLNRNDFSSELIALYKDSAFNNPT